jgi:hypothetical protein
VTIEVQADDPDVLSAPLTGDAKLVDFWLDRVAFG